MKKSAAALAWTLLYRALTGAAGLGAGLLAAYIPLTAYWNYSIEAESAQGYGLRSSHAGLIGYCLTMLVFTGFSALVFYVLMRLCIKPRKQSERRPNAASV